jgi:hypothetical protein
MPTPSYRILVKGVAVATAPALLLGGIFWAVSPAPDTGLSPWNDLAEAQRRSESLDHALQDTARRLEAKEALARALAAGRVTLLEAAARLRDLDRGKPDFNWEEFRRAFRGASDDERHCREVIKWVRMVNVVDTPQDEATARRLEAELQYHIDHGTLRLDGRPTPGPGRPPVPTTR